MITRIESMAALFGVLLAGLPGAVLAEGDLLTVYKTPFCGCCGAWVDHVRAAGFEVEVTETDDLQQIKTLAGIPPEAQACHTAMIGGYTIEGHVPADIIARLLEERPAISGIAVPGMPVGSPGMEGPNPQAYDVLTVSAGVIGEPYATVTPEQAR